MCARASFDYAVVRIVPRPEREEFINAGVILFCRQRRFLDCRIELDEMRLSCLSPGLDVAEVERHLDVIPLACKGDPSTGPIAKLPLAGRFHWLVAPRSTVVQPSPVHSGLCEDPRETLEHLLEAMVRVPDENS
jgi:hypothetical protein